MNGVARPILAEPDQRYWRRKANRRVKQARLTRSLRRWSAILLAFAIVGAALFQAGSQTLDRIKTDPGLAVRHIEIEGVEVSGAPSIRATLEPFAGRNIVDLNLYEVKQAAQSNPWVLDASAKRVLPGTLRVTITERRPAAVAWIRDRPWVIDATGARVAEKPPGRFDDLARLTGLERYEDQALVAALERGVRALGELERAATGWIPEIAEIDLARDERIAVRTVDPGPAILLDPARVERNLNPYLELRNEIAHWTGPVEYVDLRWRDRIVVMPGRPEIAVMEDG